MWIKLGFFKKNSGCGWYTGALNRPKITVIGALELEAWTSALLTLGFILCPIFLYKSPVNVNTYLQSIGLHVLVMQWNDRKYEMFALHQAAVAKCSFHQVHCSEQHILNFGWQTTNFIPYVYRGGHCYSGQPWEVGWWLHCSLPWLPDTCGRESSGAAAAVVVTHSQGQGTECWELFQSWLDWLYGKSVRFVSLCINYWFYYCWY